MLLQSIWLQCAGAAMAVWALVLLYFFSTYISSSVGSSSDVSSTHHQQQSTKTTVSSSDSSIDIEESSNDSYNAQDDINSCNDAQDIDTSNKWRWEPTSKNHTCTIHRISHTELHRLFGDTGLPNLYPYPLVIYPDDDKWKEQRLLMFTNLTTLDNLPTNFRPDFNVTLTGSDSLSTHRRSIPLKQYLDEEVLNANDGSGITPPDKLGNETWYLFGETFTDDWITFLKHYDPLPPCASCTPLHRMQGMVALSFGIGNIGSGVQWHLHGPGFSETIHGRKHWVLYPPEYRPSYNLDYASRHWMEHTFQT